MNKARARESRAYFLLGQWLAHLAVDDAASVIYGDNGALPVFEKDMLNLLQHGPVAGMPGRRHIRSGENAGNESIVVELLQVGKGCFHIRAVSEEPLQVF